MLRNLLLITLLFLFSCNNFDNNSKNNLQKTSKTDSLNNLADNLYVLGRSYSEDSLNQERALELYKESFELYKQLGNKQRIATLYKRMGFAYEYMEDYPKVKEYQKKALKINIEIDNKNESAIISNFLGIAYTITGDIDSALTFYAKGLELSEITMDTAEIIEIYQNMGISYRYAGNYEKAIESDIKALKYCEEVNYTTGIFSLNLNIAQLFQESGDIDMAFSYCEKASELIDSIENTHKQASFHHTFGELYYARTKYIKAREYFVKTLEISRKVDFKRGMAAAYTSLALISLKEHNFDEEEKYAYLSIDLENEINNISGVISSLLTIAETQYQQKLYDKALVQLQKAENLCNEKGLYDQLPDIYYHFYQVYKRDGKQKLALRFCENYYTLKDSLTGIEVKEKIADLEIKHQTEKKQQEIELLNEENNTKKQKLKARNRLIILLILLVIVIIGIAYFFRQRAIQKLNKMESEIQKYILKIKDLHDNNKIEPEITSKEFLKKHDITDRETEVLHLICGGMSNADIAEKIFVSTNTVKYHIKNIYLKLDVKNRVEALNKLNPN